MPSPFPGMDPYIEYSAIWVDFHNSLADEIRAQLNSTIRPTYFARLTPRTTYDVVEISQVRTQTVRPDLGVFQRQPAETPTFAPVAVAEGVIDPPIETIDPLDLTELLSVEIRRTGSNVLVTAIEILSPINKLVGHPGYEEYHRKRRDLLTTTAHVMEIDLLRGGTRPVLGLAEPGASYYVILSRAEQRPYLSIWPIPLSSRLPVVAVPLLAPDPDVPLDLGAIVATVYERGGYDVQIDYGVPVPSPQLEPQDAAWVEQLLAEVRSSANR
jgi:hypothetical protein